MLRTYKKNLYVQTSKKQKVRFFSGELFKKATTGLLLLMVIVTSFSPLFGVKKAHAEDNNMGVIWPNEDSGLITSSFGGNGWFNLEEASGLSDNSNYTLYSRSVNIKKNADYSANTSAKFNIHLELSDFGSDGYPSGAPAAPAKDTNKNGKFDKDDEFGDWNSILDNDIENSRDNGIFLQLIKVGKADATGKFPELQIEKVELAKAIKTTDNGKSFNIAKLITVDRIKNPQIKKPLDATVRAVYPPAFASELLGGPNLQSEEYAYDGNSQVTGLQLGFEGKIINIGAYFWRFKSTGYQTPKDEGGAFFGRTKFDVLVPVDGLEAGTRYYYRLIIKEDGSKQNAYTAVNSGAYFDTPTDKPTDLNLLESDAGVMSSDTGEATKLAFFKDNIECSATDASTWFSGCLVKYIWYDFLYRTSSWLLRAAAGLMDVFIAYSLSDIMYRTPSFIVGGWTVVRDICNMFFIFILLWTAFKMVVNDSHFHANKVIVNIIIVGLLINFSLFFSKLIIDAGNITARVFYNQITITGTAQDQVTGAVKSEAVGVAPKALSEAITSGFGIEQMFSEKTYNKLAAQGGVGTGDMFIIITLGIIVNLIAAWMFFKTSFYFIGRILSLWFAMIFSPAAFTTKILHETEHTAKFGWADWLKNILSASFGAPMFMFFIYLIIRFIGSGFLDGLIDGKDSLDFTGYLIIIILQFMFLIGLIKAASDVAKTMSGMFGGAVAGALEGAAKFVGGAAIGVATGGAALAGSRLLGGRAASTLAGKEGDLLKKASTGDAQALLDLKALDSKKYGKWEAGEAGRKKAQERVERLQKTANSSFDLRNTKGAQALSSATGINFNAGLGSSSLGTAATAGGFQATVDKRAAKQAEYFKNIGASEDEIKRAKGMVDETKKELEEAEKDKRKEIERLERENANYVQQRQAGDTTDHSAAVATNQTAIQTLKTELDNAHAEAKVKDPSGNFVTPPSGNPIAIAKQNALKAEEDYKKSSKSGLRAYQEYLQNNFHHGGRQEQGAWFGVRGLRSVFRSDGLMGAASHFASGFGKDMKAAISGAWKGALAGSILPGMGTIGGAIAGAVGGGVLGAMQKNVFNQKVIDMADHAVAANHLHGSHAKADYKQPGGAWLDKIFNGGGFSLGGGGGHGGGHDAGHDDHGGGHH